MSVKPSDIALTLSSRFLNFGKLPKVEQKVLLAESVERITFDGKGNAQFHVKVGMPSAENAMQTAPGKAFRKYGNLEMRSCWPA